MTPRTPRVVIALLASVMVAAVAATPAMAAKSDKRAATKLLRGTVWTTFQSGNVTGATLDRTLTLCRDNSYVLVTSFLAPIIEDDSSFDHPEPETRVAGTWKVKRAKLTKRRFGTVQGRLHDRGRRARHRRVHGHQARRHVRRHPGPGQPHGRVLRAAVTLGLLATALSAPVASAAIGDVERVSVATNGAEGDGDSTAPSISHDGNVVAFQSRAGTLVGGDGNGGLDVFTRRRAARNTQRISGGPGVSAGSTNPVVSADGSSVAFESFAPELGGGVFGDIFLRRGGGAIVRVSAPTGHGDNVGGRQPSISGDGTTVVFESATQELIADDDNGLGDIFSWRGGSITRLSEGFAGAESNGSSEQPALSSDGRFAAFRSERHQPGRGQRRRRLVGHLRARSRGRHRACERRPRRRPGQRRLRGPGDLRAMARSWRSSRTRPTSSPVTATTAATSSSTTATAT